jgi:hypothetical protein
MRIFILFLFLSVPMLCQGQTKVEKESAVSASEVPTKAVDWVNRAYPEKNRLKWYKEVSSGGISFEAKLKYCGRWHSVEFSDEGHLEDVEIDHKLDELPQSFQEALEQYLQKNYQRHRVYKVQVQLSGDSQLVAKAIQAGKLPQLTIRYELEYFGRVQDEDETWEGLFDADGTPRQQRKVKQSTHANLVF